MLVLHDEETFLAILKSAREARERLTQAAIEHFGDIKGQEVISRHFVRKSARIVAEDPELFSKG